MIEYRRKYGISTQSMATMCRVSTALIEMLESCDRDVTHPKCADRIAKAYRMTKEQAESLIPEHHRKSSPAYDPDKYKNNDVDFGQFAITPGWCRVALM